MVVKNDEICFFYPHISVVWEELNRVSNQLSLESSTEETNGNYEEIKINIMADLLMILSGPQSTLEESINSFMIETMDLFGDHGIFLASTILENLENLRLEVSELLINNNNRIKFPKEEKISKEEYINLVDIMFRTETVSTPYSLTKGKVKLEYDETLNNGQNDTILFKSSNNNSENQARLSLESPKIISTRTEIFEKVFISPQSISESVLKEIEPQLILTERLNKKLRLAFRGIKRFNFVQSKVFSSIYLSNRNVLVAAPTGSGKTNIALLAILKSISDFVGINALDSGEISDNYQAPDPNKFKIVFIAPMKSLVSEITRKYSVALQELGIKVVEITSDVTVLKEAIDRNHIIVTVPEKFDIMTRNYTYDNQSEQGNLLNSLQCVILDEIHMLGDERGPSVEAIVSRILFNVEVTQRPIRLVGLSATLPNWEDFATFLNVNKNDAFFFSQALRPTPLEKTIIGVNEKRVEVEKKKAIQKKNYKPSDQDSSKVKEKKREERQENKVSKQNNTEEEISSISDLYNSIAFKIVLDCLEKNEQVLVFVHSRNETLSTALYFKRMLNLYSRKNCFIRGNFCSNNIGQNISNGPIKNLTIKKDQRNTSSINESKKIDNKEDLNKNYFLKTLRDCENPSIKDLFNYGLGIHHAGLISNQRKLSEALFSHGLIRVLITTATLAWGVNLPARHVIIKGTNVYDSKKGSFRDLGILDILQIFGRAGRPQFDSLGSAYMITSSEKLQSYVNKLTFQAPIESQLSNESNLCNLLNSEIARGSILSAKDASRWLKYTFLVTRAKKSPILYGLKTEELLEDPSLTQFCYNHISKCLDLLYQSKLIRYNVINDEVSSTHYGRLTSRYYIDFNTSNIFRKLILENEQNSDENTCLSDFDILEIVGEAKEFSSMNTREEEIEELESLVLDRQVAGIVKKSVDVTKVSSKVALLLIAYSLRTNITTPTLIMDSIYVSQNGTRILRFIFELIQLSTYGVSERAQRVLEWSKMLEMRIFYTQSILRHFVYFSSLYKTLNPNEVFVSENSNRNPKFKGPLKIGSVKKLEDYASWEMIKDLMISELKDIVYSDAEKVSEYIKYVPNIDFKEAFVSPVTQRIVKLGIKLNPNWKWNQRWHGIREKFHLWVTNPNDGAILHTLQVQVTQKNINNTLSISELIPIPDYDPPFFLNIKIISDKWVSLDFETEINLRPALESFNQYFHIQKEFSQTNSNRSNSISLYSISDITELLNVSPIPIYSLRCPEIINYYNNKNIFFLNPIQSQLFHILFHSDENVFLGAPTGSGKTMIAEIAIFRALIADLENQISISKLKTEPKKKSKVVYIAPLKSLANERFNDWKKLFSNVLGLKVVLITGSSRTSIIELERASIIISTPEKWESLTRRWWAKSRSFVLDVRLIIFDEIHLIGQDPRGSVVENLVCKTKFISKFILMCGINKKIRTISLSTSLSNAKELSSWLEVGALGYFNFPPAIRPVPCTVYISGFQEKNYCPRMATMNRPIYNKILAHSPKKPVIIFVASRRQTRITAMSLSHMCYCDGQPSRFINTDSKGILGLDLASSIFLVKDRSLKQTLESGIGIHHAGLSESDRNLVERLFLNGIIQIVVATSTLAWGVNFPAHFAIIKGTEYFDAKLGQYIDYPITDVLQMIGRAGRPQYDSHSVASIMTLESKKSFFKRFLYDSLPLESCFGVTSLIEIFNAEVSSLSIKSISDAICFLSNSFFLKRVIINPAYYDPNVFQIEIGQTEGQTSLLGIPRVRIIVYILEKLINDVLRALIEFECIQISFGKKDNSGVNLKFSQTLNSSFNNNLKDIREFDEPDPGIGKSKSGNSMYLENQNFTWSKLFPNINEVVEIFSSKGPPISLYPTLIGQISSFFYVKCATICKLNRFLHCKVLKNRSVSWVEILSLVSQAQEFEIHPVRHNEDKICTKMLKYLPFGKLPLEPMSSPHQKVFILLQANIFSIPVEVVDFINDINSILDQVPRILHAFIQLNKLGNYLLSSAFNSTLLLLECIRQKCHPFASPLYQIPLMRKSVKFDVLESKFKAKSLYDIAFRTLVSKEIDMKKELSEVNINAEQILNFLYEIPLFQLKSKIIDRQTHHSTLLVEICIRDYGKVFPPDWFNLSWVYIENKTKKLVFIERLARSRFKFMEDNKFTLHYNFNVLLNHKDSSVNRDYKVCIASEKYIGIQVSYLLE
ncbi:U5 small nuclear ribonucleoprotein [Cryptosporidium ubiquitum]|uniref:U5 small nuclear ribonucleoprotein n=1 Tax=Cryptosporidium ubiquitum TaxID=857276 RepID=A0A1J4MC90_9CRYT|nr:U5 small nuclear ribonucleoprotein [Cryptosporidium ubiquitum]OII71849.1 U5 small nuclear ribonucleoprotein [Cryptosporidium ubiquitum]